MTARRLAPSRESLSDSVYRILIDQFMAGEREASSPLNIDALSRELGVSPTPVREALARLEHTGLVYREALRGYRVAPLFTEPELVRLMDARLVVEPTLARLAAQHATETDIADLAHTIDALRDPSVAGPETSDIAKYWAADHEFHALIARVAGNPFLERAHAALGGHVQRFRFFAKLGSSDAPHAADEHTRILVALRTGRPEEAADAMREHIELAKARALADHRLLSH